MEALENMLRENYYNRKPLIVKAKTFCVSLGTQERWGCGEMLSYFDKIYGILGGCILCVARGPYPVTAGQGLAVEDFSFGPKRPEFVVQELDLISESAFVGE